MQWLHCSSQETLQLCSISCSSQVLSHKGHDLAIDIERSELYCCSCIDQVDDPDFDEAHRSCVFDEILRHQRILSTARKLFEGKEGANGDLDDDDYDWSIRASMGLDHTLDDEVYRFFFEVFWLANDCARKETPSSVGTVLFLCIHIISLILRNGRWLGFVVRNFSTQGSWSEPLFSRQRTRKFSLRFISIWIDSNRA